jgi:hypothetical protein
LVSGGGLVVPSKSDDPADELAALVLEYGRRPLLRRATQLARKVLGGNARE